MSEQEVEKYVHDVAELVELCRQVASRIADDGNKHNTIEKQFKAIESSVTTLERQGVAVPDVLRNEKVRLGTLLADISGKDYRLSLGQLASSLKDLSTEICRQYGVTAKLSKDGHVSQTCHARDNGMRTPNAKLRQMVVTVLRDLGGSAIVKDVIAGVDKFNNGNWLPGDLQLRKDGRSLVWDNNVRWEVADMKRIGLMRSDVPHGIWALSESEIGK